MTQTEILNQLQSVFDEVFLEKVVVNPELSAKDVAEWDSLAHITLMIEIEKTFQVHFRVGEVESTKNLGELANLIEKRIHGN